MTDIINPSEINRIIVEHPASTFYARVRGDLLKCENIHDGDLLVIDKSIEPLPGMLCVCYIKDGFEIRQVRIKYGRIYLVSFNENIPYFALPEEDQHSYLFGVITYSIKREKKKTLTVNERPLEV